MPPLEPESRLRNSIGVRITIGFTIVLLLHLFVAALGHFGLNRAEADLARAQVMQAQVSKSLEVDAEVVELQRNVLLYAYTGDRGVANGVLARAGKLEQHLHSFTRKVSTRELEQYLLQMIQALEAYRSQFDAVVTGHEYGEAILGDSFVPYSATLQDSLGSAFEQSVLEERYVVAASVGSAIQHLLQAKASADDYIRDPGADAIDRFRSASGDLALSLDRLLEFSFDEKTGKGIRSLRSELESWQSSFFQVVNSIRSYLHLVNVVMAGQALEIRTLSALLREGAIEELSTFETALSAEQESFRRISGFLSVFTTLVGVFAGWWIGRSISRPVVAMTETFTSLARGEEIEIPGLERQDEIGQMARAAEVFGGRNRETEQLLESSRELGRQYEQANHRLQISVRELERRNEELDQFSYSASHDLKAPLRAISHLSQWIEEDSEGTLSESVAGHLKTLRERTSRLEMLLDGLLKYSRAGRVQIEPDEFSVREVLDSVVELISPPAGMRVGISGATPVIVGSRPPFQQVCQNLIANSIEHHDRSEGEISITVEDLGSDISLRFRDDGPGIAPRFQKKVFQMFQTLQPRDEKETSGLGLALVQKLVLGSGGSIELASDGVRGCEFHVTWPKSPIVHDDPTRGEGLGRFASDGERGRIGSRTVDV